MGTGGFGEPRGDAEQYLVVGAIRSLSPGEQPGPGGAPGGEAISESIPDPAGRRVVSSDPKMLPKCLKTPQEAPLATP